MNFFEETQFLDQKGLIIWLNNKICFDICLAMLDMTMLDPNIEEGNHNGIISRFVVFLVTRMCRKPTSIRMISSKITKRYQTGLFERGPPKSHTKSIPDLEDWNNRPGGFVDEGVHPPCWTHLQRLQPRPLQRVG